MQYKQKVTACNMGAWPFTNISMINCSPLSRAQYVRFFLAPARPLVLGSQFFSDEKPKIKKQLPNGKITVKETANFSSIEFAGDLNFGEIDVLN